MTATRPRKRGASPGPLPIATQIRQAREAAGLSQEELATRLGYSSNAPVSRWEGGVNVPQVPALQRIAGLLGVVFEIGPAPPDATPNA